MALRIASSAVVGMIKRLAKVTGLTKTAAVEAFLEQETLDPIENIRRRMRVILGQIDRTPDLPAPFDPLEWDEHGLPR